MTEPGKIQGPTTSIGHNLHPAGIGGERRIERSRRRADFVPLLHPAQCPRQRLAGQKRFVPLDVHDGVERGEVGARGNLGNPIGSGLM